MLVCGSAPFQEANDSETLTMIMDCNYIVSIEVMTMDHISTYSLFSGSLSHFQFLPKSDQQHAVPGARKESHSRLGK